MGREGAEHPDGAAHRRDAAHDLGPLSEIPDRIVGVVRDKVGIFAVN
jgi:hypothetical protein